jgi:predicted Na+-dependent transporter
MEPKVESRETMHVVLSTIVPFILGLCATQITMAFGERHGTDTLPFVLVGWCVALGASAAWLNWAVFRDTKMLLTFFAAIVAILLVWLWQWLAFRMLVPGLGLKYGYFLRPEGAKAGFWVLTCHSASV